MKWSLSDPRPSALSGVTGDRTLYCVHLLSVPSGDDLAAAFTELWQRLLLDGRKSCSDSWEILLIEFWSDAGLFVAVFTTKDRRCDEPSVYKISSEQIELEYSALPSPSRDLEAFSAGYDRLQNHYWQLLREAALASSVAGLLAEWRREREVPVWGMNCSDMESMLQLDI